MRKFHLTIIVIVLAWTNLADSKSTRTNQSLKKATLHLKPTKRPKHLLDTFKALPADDFEFIKQLDKQFNKFGDNVKIKLQKVNRTSNASSKNTKRTIDGSIGYGYQHPNDQQSMYTFSKPRYEIYPYSQHDIPPVPRYYHQQPQNHLNYLRHYPTALVESDSNYYGKQTSGHTSVEVQPSHSYEIKQTEHGYQTIFHGGAEQAQDYSHSDHVAPTAEPVPVIVLRVPGPAKYASHLQALLQQYLEARAAKYLHELQEQEAHGIDSSQQISHVPDISAYSALPVLPYGPHQAYLPAQMYIQPIAQIQPYYSQQTLANPYANAHIAQPIEVEDDHDHDHDHVAVTPTPLSYYSAHAQSQPSDDTDHTGVVHPTAYQYQNIHDDQSQQQYSDHDTNAEAYYGQEQPESVSQHNQLLTNENYPDDKHTRVVFKTSTEPTYSDQYDNEHQPQPYLPQSQVNTYRAPLVYQKSEHFYSPHEDQADGSAGYDENAQSIVSSTPYENTVTITQRPAVLPQNYHAQLAGQIGSQLAQYTNGHGYDSGSTEASNEYLYKRNSNKKRQSIQNRDDQYKKFKNLANRMKARISSEMVQA